MTRCDMMGKIKKFSLFLLLISLAACSSRSALTSYHDPNMDFAAVRTVAVMPFDNLTRDSQAADRVRDIFANSLLSTGALYVIPSGEVSRGVARAGILNPAIPSMEEIAKFSGIIKVDAIITGSVTEYGEVRSGNANANVISFQVQMIETQTRTIVWTASSTRGGVSFWDRLFGSGGEPMNDVTLTAVADVIDKLFD